MRRIHPNLVAAVFIIVYLAIGLFISLIIKKNLFESKGFLVIALIGGVIINFLFVDKYYDKILEEKKEEAEFLNKAMENRKKLEDKE